MEQTEVFEPVETFSWETIPVQQTPANEEAT